MSRYIGMVMWIMPVGIMPACIHTYPDENACDPTSIQIAVEVDVDIDWQSIESSGSRTSSGRGMPDRLIVEFFRKGVSCGRYERVLEEEEKGVERLRVKMPFNLHAVDYKVVAWLDHMDSGGNSSVAYDAVDMTAVVCKDSHIRWESWKECGFCTRDISLQEYRDKWNSKVIVPLELTSPLGRFRFRSVDGSKFRDYVSENLSQGESYTVCLSFNGRIGEGFDALYGEPVFFKEKPEYYYPLDVGESSDADVHFGAGAMFAGPDRQLYSVSVIVYNSARIIMSKSADVVFPLERGKETVITGEFLTNYFSNQINVDNIWDGEIIIEI